MALKELNKIATEITDQYSLNGVIIIHRLGTVLVGESSIFVGCASPHRQDAIKAVEEIMDLIKQRVPIWKKEHLEDGTFTWKQNKEWDLNFTQ